MADRTLEPPRNGRSEETAGEAHPPATAAKAPAASSSPWMPLFVTVVSMPLLAYATTRFVLLPQMTRALSQPSVVAAAESAATNGVSAGFIDGKPKVTIPMSKILVNVAGTMGTRYLMTSITLVGNDQNLASKVEQNRDQLMDLATGSLCTKTISDLEKPGARNVIRAELMTVFNNALGGPFIKEIYITELAIQ
jgi:flagellar FliL protein